MEAISLRPQGSDLMSVELMVWECRGAKDRPLFGLEETDWQPLELDGLSLGVRLAVADAKGDALV